MKAVIFRLFLYSCISINLFTGWLKKLILIFISFFRSSLEPDDVIGRY